MEQRIAPKAFDLIIRFETGGRAYYDKFLARPSWPGGASGVTIGFGYDLGYEKNFAAVWGKHLSPDTIARLSRTLGKTRSRAQQAISGVRDIVIAWETGAEVFNDHTLPQEIRTTLQCFGMAAAEKLSANAFGALVSLVFNRGEDLDGDRRREMRAIKSLLAGTFTGDRLHKAVAREIDAMRRLWPDNTQSDNDLNDRRRLESALVLDKVE